MKRDVIKAKGSGIPLVTAVGVSSTLRGFSGGFSQFGFDSSSNSTMETLLELKPCMDSLLVSEENVFGRLKLVEINVCFLMNIVDDMKKELYTQG